MFLLNICFKQFFATELFKKPHCYCVLNEPILLIMCIHNSITNKLEQCVIFSGSFICFVSIVDGLNKHTTIYSGNPVKGNVSNKMPGHLVCEEQSEDMVRD